MYEIKITDLSTGKVAYESRAATGAFALDDKQGQIRTLYFYEDTASAIVLTLLGFDAAKEEWLDSLGIRKAYNLAAALAKETEELRLKETMRSAE